MLLIHSYTEHVSNDTVSDFEDALLEYGGFKRVLNYSKIVGKLKYLAFRFFRKFGIDTIPEVRKAYKNNPINDKKHLFAIMMGLDELKWRPYGLNSFHNKSVFLFDAWPKDYLLIVQFCRKYHINFLFVTSRLSSVRLMALMPHVCVKYIPEAINPNRFQFRDYHKKEIDVISIGRKWGEYHDKIVEPLKEKGVIYLYEKKQGEVIFPDRDSFINGLAKAKISICIPSSISHPDRAGDVETMTVRYLESMASKCLVLGKAPNEMIELFGYDPVVEIDMDNPIEQILDILLNYNSYIPLIEKNFMEVKMHQTWRNRIDEMTAIWRNEV